MNKRVIGKKAKIFLCKYDPWPFGYTDEAPKVVHTLELDPNMQIAALTKVGSAWVELKEGEWADPNDDPSTWDAKSLPWMRFASTSAGGK